MATLEGKNGLSQNGLSQKIWFIMKEMDPCIHRSAAENAARATAGAAADAVDSAAGGTGSAVFLYYVTRCSCLGATCEALYRKLWGES